jgi:hypothetical protein
MVLPHDFRSIKHPADSDKKAEDKVTASEGNDDFDLEKFILVSIL